MQPGDLLDLDVTGIAHGGVSVARHDGRVIFVSDAIPGERVRARLTDTGKAAYWRADTVDVLDASPHRRPHVWREADIDVPPENRPGGADFGHIGIDHQRSLKLEVLQDALRRIGKLDVPATMSPAHPLREAHGGFAAEDPAGLRWRTRVSLHVDGAGRVGPYASRSHRVVPVDDLPLATEEVARVAREMIRDGGAGGAGRIDLVQPSDSRVRVIRRPNPRPTRRGRTTRGRRSPGAPSGTPGAPGTGGGADAREIVIERVQGREFHVDAGGFWQVHRLAASTLTDLVRARLTGDGSVPPIDPDGWHLDLYGGVGLFAATIGDAAGASARVTSVESDDRATMHARENLAGWAGASAETERVDRWLTELAAVATAAERAAISRGAVVLDPPRSGAGREVVEHVAGLAPERVVYVACDPVALARDLATFAEHDYRTSAVEAVDLFPNSHHIEAVALFTR